MKVILLEDMKLLGKKGEMLEVNDSYAKNFLIPNKKCTVATAAAQNELKQRQEKEAREKAAELAAAIELHKKLNNANVNIKVKTTGGKMHGSVTAQDVCDTLKAAGFTVEKKCVVAPTIKTVGEYRVDIRCAKGYIAKLNVTVTDK